MKTVLLIALVLGLISTVTAQTSNTAASGAGECKLTLAQAPVIRGIRLGMTAEQVLAQIPGAESDSNLLAGLSRDYFGSRSSSVVPGNYATAKEKFAGISSINVTFLDGRLVSLYIQYAGPEWRSNAQFVARLAEVLSLPSIGSWKPSNNGLALMCDGFEIWGRGNPPVIAMKDLKADTAKVVREREEVLKEKARRAFKP
jgi:hypothetical protein